jgi:ABC-type iron transport system FetAB permease component
MDNNKKQKAPKRELTKLEKRYKKLRWSQYILFVVSIAFAIVPCAVAIIKTGIAYKTEGTKWSLSGYVVFLVMFAILLIFKGLREKFRDKIPWSTGAAIGMWVMTGFIMAIKAIIEDALILSFVIAMGCTIASVLCVISDYSKTQADALETEYRRRSD